MNHFPLVGHMNTAHLARLSNLLFDAAWCDVAEGEGYEFPLGANRFRYAPTPDPAAALAITLYYIGRIEQGWGISLTVLYAHMGISPDEEVEATYRAIMNCFGHGIGINDDWSEEFDRASQILSGVGIKSLEPAPFYDEGLLIRDYAEGLYLADPKNPRRPDDYEG